MTVQVLNASGSYRVVPGEEWRTSALVLVPLLDEWTQAAPSGVTARALSPNTYAHVTAAHLVVTGLARLALPSLATAAADIVVELRRDRRPPVTVVLTIPMGTPLPYFAPLVAVPSTTVRLTGRVSAAAFPHAPVSGATVAITGVGGALVTASVPLALDHPSGTTVRVRPLAAGAGTTLAAPITAGDTVLTLASTAGIAAGTLLAVGNDVLVTQAVTGPVVLLRTPVAASAATGAAVTVQTPGAVGTAATLTRAVLPGDGVLLTTGALGGSAVEVVDGAATEYRRTTLTTDADGRWTLSGVRGIPEVNLAASAGGFLPYGPRVCPLAPIDPIVANIPLRT